MAQVCVTFCNPNLAQSFGGGWKNLGKKMRWTKSSFCFLLCRSKSWNVWNDSRWHPTNLQKDFPGIFSTGMTTKPFTDCVLPPSYQPTYNPPYLQSYLVAILPAYNHTYIHSYLLTILPTYDPTFVPNYLTSFRPTIQSNPPTTFPTNLATNEFFQKMARPERRTKAAAQISFIWFQSFNRTKYLFIYFFPSWSTF